MDDVNPYIDPPTGVRMGGASLGEAKWNARDKVPTRAFVEETEHYIHHILTALEMVTAKNPEAMLKYVKHELTLKIAEVIAERLEWELARFEEFDQVVFRCRFLDVRIVDYIRSEE